jgi:cobalt-zinc-cadmium efflux system membrane fusion protein
MESEYGIANHVAPAETVPTPSQSSLAGGMIRMLSGLAVVALLAAAAYWGHVTEWTFSPSALRPPRPVEPHSSQGLTTVRPEPGPAARSNLPPALRRGAVIAFDSAEAVERAGIDVTPAWTAAMTEAVTAGGEVRFDPARVARLSARAGGPVRRVFKTVGDAVRAGEVLALVDAAAVGRGKAEFLRALVSARLKRTVLDNLRQAGSAVPAQQLREAEAAVKDAETRLLSAEQALHNLGLPLRAADYAKLSADDAARRLRSLGIPDAATPGGEPTTANLLPVTAPLAGTVLKADVVVGEVVQGGKVLFVVVDPSRVWLILNVSPVDIGRVKVGREGVFRPDGVPEEFTGRVTWVGTAAGETTRAVPVRVELPNPGGQLRASMFGQGRIILRKEPNALVVPSEAVQMFHGTPVVFVRDANYLKPGGPKAFHARPVQTGAKAGRYTEIRSGLAKGEVVATRGSNLLLGELERFALGSVASR